MQRDVSAGYFLSSAVTFPF